MEYGQSNLPLRQPNVIIGRGSDGDWVNDYNQPQLDLQESHTALEGFDAIAEYIESALEKFEDSADVQAGLVAIKLLHHYAEEFGELPEPLLWDMAMAVLQSSQPSEYLYLLALDSHPTIAGALRGIMQGRIRHYSSILAMTQDKHLMAYLEATNQDSPAALQAMISG